jgi:hypothetical protein
VASLSPASFLVSCFPIVMDHTEHRLGTSYSHDSSLTVPTALCGQQLSNSPHQASRDCVSQAETPSLTSTPPLSTAVSSKSGKSPFISHLSTTPRLSAALGHSAPNQPSAYPTPPQTIQRAIEAGKMSTLGIHFDPHFDPISRASYSWPCKFTWRSIPSYACADSSSI